MAARRFSVPMPPAIAKLPRDPRGFPIAYIAARWEHLVMPPPYERRYGLVAVGDRHAGKKLDLGHMDEVRQRRAWADGRCQVCGLDIDKIRSERWVAGGVGDDPLDTFTFREPWACGPCMTYAIQVCPGLVAGHLRESGNLRVVRVLSPVESFQERLTAGGPIVVPNDPDLPDDIKRGSVCVYLLSVVHDGEVFTPDQFLAERGVNDLSSAGA